MIQNEIKHLLDWRNKVQQQIYDILEKHSDDYNHQIEKTIDKLWKEIYRINRRITKLERMESNGIQVYEPDSSYI